ncbi:MAG: lipid II flippase MurJ [Burkholderiales bacterium]
MFISVKKLLYNKKEQKVLEALIKGSFINIIARIFAYLKYVIIGIFFGFNAKTDAFFITLSLIGIFLIFTDVFNSLGIPQLVKARQNNLEEFNKLASSLLTLTVGLIVAITLIAVIIYPVIAKIPIGFNKTSLIYVKNVYYILIPYLSLNFIFHYCGCILRSMRRFTSYFIGELIFSFCSFLFILLGLHFFHSYIVFPSALSLAQAISTLYMIFITREFLHIGFFVNNTTKQIFRQFWYLILLNGIFYIFIVIDKSFASLLQTKSISALTYGIVIASLPVSILRLDHITITSLAEQRYPLGKLNFYIKKIILISAPMIIFYLLFSGLLIKLFFLYGAFSKIDAKLTANATIFYSLNIPALLIWPLILRTFQIRDNLKPIFVIALIGIIINSLLNYLFVIKLHLEIEGIILGTIFAYIVMCSAGYMVLINNKSMHHNLEL